MRISPCSLALLAALASYADATLINIDFNDVDHYGTSSPTYTGLAGAPDPAGSSAYWNNVSAPWKDVLRAEALRDSAGTATSVALSLATSSTFANLGDQETGGPGGAFADLMSDYAMLDSGSSTVVRSASGTFSGLVPSATYDLYFYGQGDNFSRSGPRGQNTLFTLGTISKQTSWDGFSTGDGLLLEDVEFVKFTAAADTTGRIAFSWSNVVPGLGGNVQTDADGIASRYAAINAIQILPSASSTVPEPAIALLGSISLLTLLRRRRLS